MAFWKDFKDFASKGNVMDLAIGVIIGGAFGKIVTSLVDDILMPLIGQLTGGIKFDDRFIVLAEGKTAPENATLEAAKAAGQNIFAYGHFLQSILDFLIVALAIFMMLRYIVNRRKKAADAPPAPTTSEALLTEIRDLLRRQ